jgi:hypothetical protein
MSNRRWRQELMAQYPKLFNMELDGRKTTLGFPEVGDGWRELVETAVSRIATAMAAAPEGSLHVVQIKEKFGTLRLYRHANKLSRTVEKAINQAVDLAEARSACTCEVCGAEGRLYQSNGWYKTVCAEHADGTIVELEAGWENLHVVRGYVGEKFGIITCRRYVRETDSFVDVDPKSLGIEE